MNTASSGRTLRRRALWLGAAASAWVCVAGSAPAAAANLASPRTYRVSPEGDDGAPAELGATLRTLQRAADLARAGDTILVHAGVYREAVVLRYSGAPGRPIVLRSHPGERAIIQPAQAPGQPPPGQGILLQALEGYGNPIGWIVVEDFEIRYGHDGLKLYNAHDIVIRDCHIHHCFNQGILGSGNRVSIDGNLIAANGTDPGAADNQLHGIYATGTSFTITNNIFHSNRAYGLQVAAYDFGPGYASLEYSGARDFLIANNTFAFNRHRGGIVLWMSGVENAVIQNNIFYRNGGAPVDADGQKGKGHLLRNNLFFPATLIYERLRGGEFRAADNQGADPLFVDADGFDFRLQPGSPAIDAGAGNRAPVHDFAGTARPQGTETDIGAFEFVPAADGAVPSVVEDGRDSRLPGRPELLGNAPNPFNSTTRIRLWVPRAGIGELGVYSATGQRLRRLMRGWVEGGYRDVLWDGRDDAGMAVGSGVYLVRLRVDGERDVLPVALLR